MKTLPLILGYTLTIHLPEIIIFMLGAIVLGFTLHYFWSARKNLSTRQPVEEGISENDNWKLKYYNDMEVQERTLQQLRERLADAEENAKIQEMEAGSLREELGLLEEKYLKVEKLAKPPTPSDEYLDQLRLAQDNLVQHNQQVNRLLQQIQLLKESEKKYQDLQQQTVVLNEQITSLHHQLSEKDAEISRIMQEQRLALEMNERLDKAYNDFSQLQEKLRKLESSLDQPHSKKVEYEQLQESYFKISREYDDVKAKQMAMFDENQRLSRILADTEDKLREANFQRQQYQKKVLFLEELNRDLQDVSEQHKKMESQLRRISEMESILSRRYGREIPPGEGPII
ncbi:MAG TPA: hypothetical protein VG890_14020 [Puia sp.]|nr:hypothetical protein [Puia sp.]